MQSYNGFSGEQRARAQRWLNAEWAAGRRRRPQRCEACGQDQGIIHAHAEDYSEPFGDHTDEYKLCYRCHMMLHCRFRNFMAWEHYRDQVRDGFQFAPVTRPNFQEIGRHLRFEPVPCIRRVPTGYCTVLDHIITMPHEIITAARGKAEGDGQRELWGERGPEGQ